MDYLIRAVAAGGTIRAFAARTTGLCEEARRRHDTWPTATAALGRTLTGAAIYGTMLGPDETVLLQLAGDGPTSPVIAWADSTGNVRGYVSEPHVHLPLNDRGKLDVAGAVGTHGNVHVIRDIALKEPYHGTVPIISGEIGLDLANYFLQSEQLPSAVGLGVRVEPDNTVGAAGGFVVQMMPGASERAADAIEKAASAFSSVTDRIVAGQTPEGMLEELLAGNNPQILERQPLRFHCGCNRDRFEGYLISLGADELERLSQEGPLELRCHFCNDAYPFQESEIVNLVQRARLQSSRN